MYIKAIIFDIGSTLVTGPDLSPASHIAGLAGLTAEEKRRVADIVLCMALKGPEHLHDNLKKIFSDRCSVGLIDLEKLWLDQENAAVEIPGASRAVMRLKERGFKIGLVSDIWAPYYCGFQRACPEIAASVDFAGLSFREGVRKPSQDLLRRVLEGLGVDPDQAWMVGDTYTHDLEPAFKLGMGTVWVLNRPGRECEAMEGVLKGRLPLPDLIVDRVADLADVDLIKRTVNR